MSVEERPEGAPREGTQSRRFWEYAQAYARGIEAATGKPCTAPAVRGPQDVLVRLLRAHCRDDERKPLIGAPVLEWLERTAREFRSTADESKVDFRGGWTPNGLARWLDDGRPVRRDMQTTGRAHIAIRRA